MGLISESKLYPHQMLFLIHRHVDLAQARREMMMAMDSALMIGFHATRCQLSTNFSSNGAPSSSWRVGGKFHGDPRDVRGDPGCCSTVRMIKSRQRRNLACASPGESLPDSPKNSWIQNYHPSEEIREPLPVDDGELARLTDAETARTLIEVNSTATLMLTEDIGEVRQNIICPDVPYLTDESGDIYFEATNDDGILRNFISEDVDDTLQVIIGLDNLELLTEIGTSGSSKFSFGVDEVIREDEDLEYDSEEDDLVIFEEEEDDVISETSNDWSHAETMQATHPVYFAQKISEAVSNANIDWMDPSSASLIIQGLLKPAFVEEHKLSKKFPLNGDAGSSEGQHPVKQIKDNVEGELNNEQSLHSSTTFFKLEIVNIQLVSACGYQSTIKVQDFHRARPDVIAHSAPIILSRLKAGGEKTTQALKALCWRYKGIQVEATSEFSAEKQTHDLLFPRFLPQKQKRESAQSRDR